MIVLKVNNHYVRDLIVNVLRGLIRRLRFLAVQSLDLEGMNVRQ